MISVSISINSSPIYTRTAVNVETITTAGAEKEVCVYKLDTGEEIMHAPDDGAVQLAIEMLRTIHEVGVHSERREGRH